MKRSLVARLRCPVCRQPLALTAGALDGDDVDAGVLGCGGCRADFAIRQGVPRLLRTDALDGVVAHTAETFGYGWAHGGVEPVTRHIPWHHAKMERALDLPPPEGLVLDAGCGDGIDVANLGLRDGIEVIGVDVSDGGVAQSWRRAGHLPRAHVVQSDLQRLPFADETFDTIYSYGVLHHIPRPDVALGELARVARPGALIAIYLYEDFVERPPLLRASLAVANALRPITTRLSPAALMRVCRLASPLVYGLCTLPSRLLRGFAATRRIGEMMPFRHSQGPFALAGDLFDRFGPPVEYRYTRAGSQAFVAGAGFQVTAVGNDRGWMVAARKPRLL